VIYFFYLPDTFFARKCKPEAIKLRFCATGRKKVKYERKKHMTKTEIRVEETGNPKEKQQIELQQVLVWVTCTSA